MGSSAFPFRAVLMLACLAAASAAAPLTVATYNVENYGPANRMTADGFRPAYPKPESEKRALRAVICALNADVLALQEIGPQPYLEELRRDLRMNGCDYPYVALAAAADPDRHVAILSRRPLAGVTTLDLEFSYFGEKQRVKRGLLQATIHTGSGDLLLFALHLKSRLTERADDPLCAIRRVGEATAIRDAILRRCAAPSDARFVLLGDCNDTKASKPLERLQRRGGAEIMYLLPAADSRGEAWTYLFKHEEAYTRVDHILISPSLRLSVVDGGARIFDGEGVATASDHRPVFVRLDV